MSPSVLVFDHLISVIFQAALEADGEISKAEAIALASSNLEKLLGLKSGTVTSDLVATTGGTVLDFESKVVGIVSAKRGVVDLF